MRQYLLRRAVFALGTLIGVSLIIFVVLRILPGDPLVAILGMEGYAKLSPVDRAHMMKDLGFADSLPVQYVRWLKDIASGQLGKSFFRGDTVADLILRRGPITRRDRHPRRDHLVAGRVCRWAFSSAIRPNGWADGIARSLAVLFIAIPGFWLGLLIVLALLFWFGYKAPIVIVQLWENPWQNFQIIVGPALILGLAQGRTSPGCPARACSR